MGVSLCGSIRGLVASVDEDGLAVHNSWKWGSITVSNNEAELVYSYRRFLDYNNDNTPLRKVGFRDQEIGF